MKTKHNKMVLEFQKLFKNNSKRTYTRKFSINISQVRSGIKSCPLHPFHVLVTKKDSRYGAKRTEEERTFTANWTVIAFSQNRFIIPRSIGVTFSREAQKALGLPFISFRNTPHKNLRVQDRLPGIILTLAPEVRFQNI